MVSIDVCTNWPATAMIGPRPHGNAIGRARLRAASAARDRLAPPVERGDLGQAGRLELVESQCGAVDDVVPVEERHFDRVGDPWPQGQRLRRRRRRPGDAPAGRRRGRSPPTSDVRAASTNSASPAVRPPRAAAGSFRVRLGGVRYCTTRCGAVHAVRGSPSVAAYAEPSTSIGSASPEARVVPGWLIRSARLGPCRGAHPYRRGHRHRLGHRQRAAEVDRLLG